MAVVCPTLPHYVEKGGLTEGVWVVGLDGKGLGGATQMGGFVIMIIVDVDVMILS